MSPPQQTDLSWEEPTAQADQPYVRVGGKLKISVVEAEASLECVGPSARGAVAPLAGLVPAGMVGGFTVYLAPQLWVVVPLVLVTWAISILVVVWYSSK